MVFSFGNGIEKKKKNSENKRKKQNKARRKLDSIENIISKVITTAEISNEEFALINNTTEKYVKRGENIRMIKSQRDGIEKCKLIEDDKGMGIDKILNNSSSRNRGIIIAHPYCIAHIIYNVILMSASALIL